MLAKLFRALAAFCIGFGLGLAIVLINGDFVIHVPVIVGILATALYLTKEKWWAFWV